MGVSLGACIGPGKARALVDLARGQARTFTYAALDALANDAAAALAGKGLRRGERVGLLGRNSAEYLAALTGIFRAGGVAVPINHRFPDETIGFVCRDAGLERVFADQDQCHRLPSVASLALEPDTWPAAAGAITSETDAAEIALVLYTSGSTVPVMSVGYPGPHVEVRLVGPGAPDEGVLQVKTPAAMSGYLNLPDKTAEKMSADGWIDTGDVMRRDDDGFYYFVGRDDDMFVCNGENVFPGQIERLLEADPRIAEACVVPKDDPVRGQIPVAFVVPAHGARIDEDAVKQIALAGAPAYMHPREVILLRRMPLAGTNKIDRQLLRRRAAGS